MEAQQTECKSSILQIMFLPVILNFCTVVFTLARIISNRIKHLSKLYCNNLIIKIVFSSFKIGTWFSLKDPSYPLWSIHSCVVYKFFCAGCTVAPATLERHADTFQHA